MKTLPKQTANMTLQFVFDNDKRGSGKQLRTKNLLFGLALAGLRTLQAFALKMMGLFFDY